MTPELPLAPLSRAEETQSAAAAIVSKFFLRSSVAALFMVSPMLVPVSPSGTGKTFRSFIIWVFAARAASAQSIISLNAAASI